MKRNGFTLIELLAVIVILAIIALIATPIILGIINDAREKANERSVELYASAARNAVASYQLTHPNAPKLFTDLTIQYDGKVECATKELYRDGDFYLEGCKVNGGTKEYSYGKERVCSIEQQNINKYSVGDVVTCNIGETIDKFYVIEDVSLTVSTIQMLTEKNIHTTEYRQSDDAGYMKFSNSIYWRDENGNLLSQYGTTYPAYVYNESSNLYQSVSAYEEYLKENGVDSASAKLISYEQLKDLGCSQDYCSTGPSKELDGNAPSWVYSTSYFTGSSISGSGIRGVKSSMPFPGGMYDNVAVMDSNGVRPVITISTSEIK